MGHTEGASGLCQIAKIVATLQTGLIPANLNYKQPHYSMKNIREDKIHVSAKDPSYLKCFQSELFLIRFSQVVDVNTKWNGGYVGINNFGFGGANSHVILKPITAGHVSNGGNETSHPTQAENVLRNFVTLSGRTEAGVEQKLREVGSLTFFERIFVYT